MDHLTTDGERRARWYATDLRPRYFEVDSSPAYDRKDGGGEKEKTVQVVSGLPASFFHRGGESGGGGCDVRDAGRLLRSLLETNGFAVITGALSVEECSESLNLAWDYIEAASGAERSLQRRRRRVGGWRKATVGEDEGVCPGDGNSLVEEVGGEGRGVAVTSDIDDDDDDNDITPANPPVLRSDPSTHSSPFFPRSVEGGILPYYGSGHSSFSWYVRSRPSVMSVFAALHGAEDPGDLISSLDGMILWRAGREVGD